MSLVGSVTGQEVSEQETLETQASAAIMPPVSAREQVSLPSAEDEPPEPPRRQKKPRANKATPVDGNVTVVQPLILSSPRIELPATANHGNAIAVAVVEEDAPPETRRRTRAKEVLIVEEVQDLQANRALRSNYADKAYMLAVGCIIFWGIAVLANGIVFATTDKLMFSDNALIAITTGVTVNVLAAFLGVIRGLFPSDSPKANGDTKSKKSKKG